MFRLTDVIPERIIFVSRGITVFTHVTVLYVKQAAFPESAVSWEVLFVICQAIGLLTQFH